MIWIQLVVVLIAIAIGARLGGIAIGFAGGIGVLALACLGVTPGDMPLDVIVIMMAVITTTAAMQAAGGWRLAAWTISCISPARCSRDTPSNWRSSPRSSRGCSS
jgi:anaerobic C4-dicarboxylate transporter